MLGDAYEKIMFCLIKHVDLCQMSILNIIIYHLVLVLWFLKVHFPIFFV